MAQHCWKLNDCFQILKQNYDSKTESTIDVSYNPNTHNFFENTNHGFVIETRLEEYKEDDYEITLFIKGDNRNCIIATYIIHNSESLEIRYISSKPENCEIPLDSITVSGHALIIFAILLAVFFRIRSIDLADVSRQKEWDDDNDDYEENRFLRQIAYENECKNNNNFLPHPLRTDCFSYYRQFGFTDDEEDSMFSPYQPVYMQGSCFNDDGTYRVIADHNK